MIANWVTQCNREVSACLGRGIQPDLQNGLQNLDQAKETVPSTTAEAAPSATHALAVPKPPAMIKEGAPEDMDATEEGPSTTVAQPGLVHRQCTFEFKGVGEFSREDDRPLSRNAYPPVTRPKELLGDDLDQAYWGQDLVDPSVIRPRHTRRENQTARGRATQEAD